MCHYLTLCTYRMCVCTLWQKHIRTLNITWWTTIYNHESRFTFYCVSFVTTQMFLSKTDMSKAPIRLRSTFTFPLPDWMCVLVLPGVAVLLSPDIPVQLGLESRQQFCLQSLPGMERRPLQYSVCVARHVKAVHQEAASQLSQHSRELPNMRTLWWVYVPHDIERTWHSASFEHMDTTSMQRRRGSSSHQGALSSSSA